MENYLGQYEKFRIRSLSLPTGLDFSSSWAKATHVGSVDFILPPLASQAVALKRKIINIDPQCRPDTFLQYFGINEIRIYNPTFTVSLPYVAR